MIRSLVRPAILSLRAFWKPFLLIQCCGIAIVLSYFYWPAFRDGADRVAHLKAEWGLTFAIVASAISGAIVPELAKVMTGHLRWDRKRFADLLFALALFGIMGIVGNYFYELLKALWPDDGRVVTIVKKVATDQFLYSSLLTLPFICFLYTIRDQRWSIVRAAKQVGLAWYLNRVVPLLVLCWCFWIPMTTLMYSLPAKLVFCFAMCAQAAWGLLMVSVAASGRLPASALAPEEDASQLRIAA